MQRRRFLGAAALACGTALAAPVQAAMLAVRPPRVLKFYNLHTAESLTTVYWEKGIYRAKGLTEISYHLRDFRTGGIRLIDPRLLDVLFALITKMDYDGPLHVISGYRSPATNAMLAKRSEGVATNSYHMRGMAIDIRMPEIATTQVRDSALDLARGGVGYYASSDFVHMDTGPVRAW